MENLSHKIIDLFSNYLDTISNIKKGDNITETENKLIKDCYYILKIKVYPNSKIILSGKETDRKIIEFNSKGMLILKVPYYSNILIKYSIIVYHALFKLIKSHGFEDNNASDMAFAIWWDLSPEKLKRIIYDIWDKQQPAEQVSLTHNIGLIYFVPNIEHALGSKNYSFFLLNRLFLYESIPKHKIFPYRVIPKSFDLLNKFDIKLICEIISKKSMDIDELSKSLNKPNSKISKSLQKIKSLNIIQERKFYTLSAVNLKTIVLFFILPVGTSIEENLFKASFVEKFNIFLGTNRLVYLKFVVPNTRYADDTMKQWIKNALDPQYNDLNAIKLIVANKPIIGIEDETQRFYSEKPELYDPKTKIWHIAPPMEPQLNLERPLGKIKLNENELIKKIIPHMLKGDKSSNEIYDLVGGRRQTVLDIINDIKRKKIIFKKPVLTFLSDLPMFFIIIHGKQNYHKFLKYIATRVPLAVGSGIKVLSNTGTSDTDFYGYCQLLIPQQYLTDFLSIIYSIDRDVMISYYTNLYGYTLPPLDNIWKFKKPTQISFNYIS